MNANLLAMIANPDLGDPAAGLRGAQAGNALYQFANQRQANALAPQAAQGDKNALAQLYGVDPTMAAGFEDRALQRQRSAAAEGRAVAGEGRAAQEWDWKNLERQAEITGRVMMGVKTPDQFAQAVDFLVQSGVKIDPATMKFEDVPLYLQRAQSVKDHAAAQGGLGANPNQLFDNVSGVRKEVRSLSNLKVYESAVPAFNSMVANIDKNSRASDIDFIYAAAKIYDPTSVVREGEQIMVSNTASLPDRIVGAINQLNGGQMLSRDTRLALIDSTRSRVNEYRAGLEKDLTQFRGIADRYKINPDDIIPPLIEPRTVPGESGARELGDRYGRVSMPGAPQDAGTPGAPPVGATATNPATGKKLQWDGYQWRPAE